MDRFFLLLPLVLFPATLAFAEPDEQARPKLSGYSRSCSAAAAHTLIGEILTAETRAQALARSGASSVRVVRVSGIRDLGLVSQRLTVAVDAQRRISELWCG